jgi:hypothetical protein
MKENLISSFFDMFGTILIKFFSFSYSPLKKLYLNDFSILSCAEGGTNLKSLAATVRENKSFSLLEALFENFSFFLFLYYLRIEM